MIEKKDLSATLGLSCVEKYFLAWLKRYYDVRKLYGNSFVGVEQVLNDFLCGATYENYCRLPRLQDIAEEYGIVQHLFLPCRGKDALEIIMGQGPEELCLIRVNAKFFLNFKRSSWREDHYICVDKDLHWINEYPLSEGKFTEEEFFNIYDGAVCLYKLEDLTSEPTDCCTEEIRAQEFGMGLSIDIKKFESAVGVLRMTRKRLKEYYAENGSVQSILNEEIVLLEKLYFKARMEQIKAEKGIKTERFATRENVWEILEYEKKLKEEIIDAERKN